MYGQTTPESRSASLSAPNSSSSASASEPPSSSASSIRSVITSTGPSIQPSSSKFPYQLLVAPQFLICAGAILFRGIPPRVEGVEEARGRRHASTITNGRGAPAPDLNAVPSSSTTSTTTIPPTSNSPVPPLQVCIIYHHRKDEYILAKGRKDQFESGLLDAALRETHEETGYACKVFPVGMYTRQPPGGADIKDQKHGHYLPSSTEPFALTIRSIAPDNVKLIHWYIAVTLSPTSSFENDTRMPSESSFESCWFEPEEALEKLTYEHDREVVRKAVGLVRGEIASGGGV